MKKAVAIGIDNYTSISPLNGCVNDARKIASFFEKDNFGFLTKTLTNESATRAEIRREIQWCLRDAEFSIIYFAGHGIKTQISTFMASYDYSEDDEGVDVNWLQRAISSLSQPGSSVLVILDCCHSGGADVRSKISQLEALSTDDIPAISGIGRILLAACTSNQKSMEVKVDGTVHGIFTHHLCEAFQGHAANNNKELTIHSIYGYVAEKLKNAENQVPVFKGDMEGEIVVARAIEKIGTWNQEVNPNQPTTEDSIKRGESLLSQILPAVTPTSHRNWLSSGYLEACQKFEPILAWFQRRTVAQPELRLNTEFSSLFASCLQIYKSLGSVMPGMKIRQGEVGMPLGSGTFGTVFHVSNTTNDLPVCFKVYHSHDLNDSQKVGRFKRGYEAMKQLDHPRIVKVRELSEIPLGFFMEYIDGANSRNFNPGSTQEPEIVVDLLLEIAETLQHAHTRGVIHRDVKPENILIKISNSGDCSAYLTDFDLSWFSAATQLTKLSEGFGSHFYAAPEQINSPNTPVAQRSTVDTYSFGQLCFFFVTGRDPLAFNPDGNCRALDQELSRKWTDSTAASDFANLYRECTRLSPEKRASDFRYICEQLAQILLLLRSPNSSYDTPTFIEQTRFTLSGEINTNRERDSFCTFRSRSGRTEVSLHANKDSKTVLGLEVVFRPDNIVMEGRTSHEARVKINSRIDAMLNDYLKAHDAKRSGAKSGAFEATVKIDHLKKDRSGVLIAREIIAKVLDQLEHT